MHQQLHSLEVGNSCYRWGTCGFLLEREGGGFEKMRKNNSRKILYLDHKLPEKSLVIVMSALYAENN